MKTLKPNIKMISVATTPTQSGTKRITGSSLYAIIKRFERTNPRVCAECKRLGLTRYGDQLDHKTPLWAGGAESDANREWLCIEHHSNKTASEAAIRAGGGILE